MDLEVQINNMRDTLISRDSKGKIRQINISCKWNDISKSFIIERQTGQYLGKLITQPEIEIKKGKVKRTIEEQAKLEYNSIVKKYKDKGYKNISDFGYSDISDFDPEKVFPKQVTDQAGVLKPMLCDVYDKNNAKNKNKTWYISRKLDGVRTILYYKDGEIRTSSRGGQNYDIASTFIRLDPFLNQLFETNPNLKLDGELYRHTWTLNVISGLCRLETLNDKHNQLIFNCYDIVDETKTFKERLEILKDIESKVFPDSKLKIVEHILIKDLDEIYKYHDLFVSEGYEGAVIRDANAKYRPGSRSSIMQKIKIFTDSEFEIIGLVEGLRDEDMCFQMKTKEGYLFKAKPVGTREDKQYYREHINEMIGKMATVKYFGMTNTECPVPNLPVWKCLALEKDR